MSMKYKIGYGKSTSLQTAIESETIDAGDVVFTSDTEEEIGRASCRERV